MWRIWNKLFGWQYALVEYGFDTYVSRVYSLPDGREYVLIYNQLIFLDDKLSRVYKLTCKKG